MSKVLETRENDVNTCAKHSSSLLLFRKHLNSNNFIILLSCNLEQFCGIFYATCICKVQYRGLQRLALYLQTLSCWKSCHKVKLEVSRLAVRGPWVHVFLVMDITMWERRKQTYGNVTMSGALYVFAVCWLYNTFAKFLC